MKRAQYLGISPDELLYKTNVFWKYWAEVGAAAEHVAQEQQNRDRASK